MKSTGPSAPTDIVVDLAKNRDKMYVPGLLFSMMACVKAVVLYCQVRDTAYTQRKLYVSQLAFSPERRNLGVMCGGYSQFVSNSANYRPTSLSQHYPSNQVSLGGRENKGEERLNIKKAALSKKASGDRTLT